MAGKTWKIMTMNRMYHPQSDTGGRGLLSIAECVETEE